MLLNIYRLLLITGFLLAYKKKLIGKKHLYLREWLFFVLLMEICFAELLKFYFSNNIIIYNIYPLLAIFYYWFIYSESLTGNQNIIGFFIFCSSIIWFMSPEKLLSNLMIEPYFIGLTLVTSIIIKYFISLISNETLYLQKLPKFYLGLGILLFYTSSFPILLFADILVTNTQAFHAYYAILEIGNIFLSLGYLGAALCSKKEI